MKRILFFSIAYVIIIVLLYWISTTSNILWTSDSWRNFATYFSGMLAPVTAFGTIYITYFIYRLTDKDRRSDLYFERIVELYFELQDTYNLVCSKVGEKERAAYISSIQAHVRIMRYYLRRLPDLSYSVKSFDNALNHIWFEPTNDKYYKSLAIEFDSFCLSANQSQERPVKPIKDENGNVKDIDY